MKSPAASVQRLSPKGIGPRRRSTEHSPAWGPRSTTTHAEHRRHNAASRDVVHAGITSWRGPLGSRGLVHFDASVLRPSCWRAVVGDGAGRPEPADLDAVGGDAFTDNVVFHRLGAPFGE